MKASHYHEITPIQEFMSKYASETPLLHEKLANVNWCSGDDEILFYHNLEAETGMRFSDRDMENLFDGNIKVANLIEFVETFEKTAEITSAEDRAKQRAYYRKNKASLARKAKIRRRRQKSGTKIKKKRTGSAATGYIFTVDSGGGPSPSKTSRGPKASGGSRQSYIPNQNASTEVRTKLKGM